MEGKEVEIHWPRRWRRGMRGERRENQERAVIWRPSEGRTVVSHAAVGPDWVMGTEN